MVEKSVIIKKLLQVAEDDVLGDPSAANGLRLAAAIIHTIPGDTCLRKVKEARWVEVTALTPYASKGRCTACNAISLINPDIPHSNYCPVCSAVMTGKAEYVCKA